MLLLLASLTLAASPHPFTAEDLNAMDRISDPQVSPDGATLLFNVRSTDLPANKGRYDLWLAGVDGKHVRPLTQTPHNETNGRWRADGKAILFLSTQSGSSQVWEVPVSGGTPRQVTQLPLDVVAFAPFPEGERLLLSIDVDPEAYAAGDVLAETAKRAKAQDKVTVRAYESLMFRHWDTWEDGLRQHLFVWSPGGGAPVPLMRGFLGDTPTRAFGGPEDFDLSPDGTQVAFAAKRVAKDNAWTTNVDVFTVPADGSAAPAPLTADNRAWDGAPAYSPDGTQLAYLAMKRPGFESDRPRIVLVDRATGKKRVLTERWDRPISSISWARDSKTIYAIAYHLGQHPLFAVDVGSGKPTALTEAGYVTEAQDAGDRVVFTYDDLASPVDLFSVAKSGGAPERVTQLNASRLAAVQLGEYEQFTFRGAKGETVHGYLVKPVGFEPGKKYPVAFLIHGGPQGSMGNHWHYRWNPQVYAGAGFAAVFIDFHGSIGYGQRFTDAIRNNWGSTPYEDLQRGLDHALRRYPFLDGGRACALGASYGGYMINWIAGKTNRFQCLVNHDGLFDVEAAYYQTEELWFPEWEFGGAPWEKPAQYARWNPKANVAKWKTPMLVIHGGKDYRVVEAQGMAAFTALQRRGIPSRFLHFEDENHWILKPQNSLRWHQEVLGWLERWTGTPEAPARR